MGGVLAHNTCSHLERNDVLNDYKRFGCNIRCDNGDIAAMLLQLRGNYGGNLPPILLAPVTTLILYLTQSLLSCLHSQSIPHCNHVRQDIRTSQNASLVNTSVLSH